MKKKPMSRVERSEQRRKLREPVVSEIIRMEKKYGASIVSAAFTRHQQVRRERNRLTRAQEEINAKIAKLNQ